MVHCQNMNSSSLECTANNKESVFLWKSLRRGSNSALSFSPRGSPQWHGDINLELEVKVGGEEAPKWWEVTEKQSEKIAGLGSKEKCRTEHKEVSCYLRATGLGEKRKILTSITKQVTKVRGKGNTLGMWRKLRVLSVQTPETRMNGYRKKGNTGEILVTLCEELH